MRILIVGKQNIMQWPENVQKFLANHQTELFLYNKTTPISLFHKLVHYKKRYAYIAQSLKQKISSFQPDLIMYISAFFIPQACYDILNDFSHIPCIGWVSDAFGAGEKPKADYLDMLFCSDTGYLQDTKTFRCRSVYLPLCVDETIFINRHLPRTGRPFFAGVGNEKRILFLKKIHDSCTIFGRCWPKKELSQHIVRNHKLSHPKMQSYLNHSVAPINMTFSKNIINGLNFRVFEISACGGLIIVNDSKDLEYCYRAGTEAIVYRTPDELNQIIHDVVANPDKYKKIAAAGYARTMQDHTYQARLKQIFLLLKKYKIITKEV